MINCRGELLLIRRGRQVLIVELEAGYNGRVVRETDYYEILDEC